MYGLFYLYIHSLHRIITFPRNRDDRIRYKYTAGRVFLVFQCGGFDFQALHVKHTPIK